MRILLLICAVAIYRVSCAFDCRRITGTCQNGSDCGIDGVCTCPDGYYGDTCALQIGSACTTLVCENGGTCGLDAAGVEICSCTDAYLGDTCAIKKAEVECGGTFIEYKISFPEEFGGLVRLDEVAAPPPVCEFAASTANGIVTYALTIRLDVVTDIASHCGSEYVTENAEGTTYNRLIMVQYELDRLTEVDEIANATCIHQEVGIDKYAELSSILLDGVGNLTVTDTDAIYSPVAFVILGANQQPMSAATELYVGDKFYLHVYLTNTDVFKNVLIQKVIFNDTNAVAPKEFTMFEEACPTESGMKTSIQQLVLDYTDTQTGEVRAGKAIETSAFKFIDSDKVGTSVQIRMCKEGDLSCEPPTDTDCKAVRAAAEAGAGAPVDEGGAPAESPPADSPPAESPPADSPPADSPPAESPPADSPPAESPPADSPPAERRRRSADDEGERTLSKVLTVRGPRGYTSDASKGEPIDATVKSCLASSEVLAMLIVLSVVVCILFIACFVLALCLIRRRQKMLQEAATYQKERFQIPRAHVNDAFREI